MTQVSTDVWCVGRTRSAWGGASYGAVTPVKRVCYIAQLAVAGETDCDAALQQLTTGIRQLNDALDGVEGAEPLREARGMLDDGNFYGVLRALRRLLPLEERLLAQSPDVGLPSGQTLQ